MQWEPKQDSPAAIDDAAQHSAFMQRCAADLAICEAPKPAATAPSPPTRSKYVTYKALGRTLEKIGRLVGQIIRESTERLEKRIAELEQRDWVGTWTGGKSFAKNSIVSHDGSAWLAVRQYPEGKPGTPNSGWKLIVKRGRDGKDATK